MAMIANSIDTKMFRNAFFVIDEQKKDILQNGYLSCAVYTSSILFLFKLLQDIHATVDGTIRDLEQSGWQKISEPKAGDVLIWEPLILNSGSAHKHIGFFIEQDQAISNSSELGYPIKHHITFGIENGQPIRKIIAIYHSDFR